MLLFNELVFDDNIDGTGATWYTAARFNALMGGAHYLGLQVAPSAVSGAPAALTMAIEHSGDGENWVAVSPAPNIVNRTLTDGDNYYVGSLDTLLRYVRISVTLNGTDPHCRLKIFACGRDV